MIEIPDELLSLLEEESYSVQEIIVKALKNYVKSEVPDITKTRTWELCGSLEIVEPDSKYIIGQDAQGKTITNYAENVDDVLY